MNGSNAAKTSPFFHNYGWLRVYSVNKTAMALVAETQIGRWCQGVAWQRRRRKTLLAQCVVEREIMTFGFDGRRLSAGPSIKVGGGPSGIRSAGDSVACGAAGGFAGWRHLGLRRLRS